MKQPPIRGSEDSLHPRRSVWFPLACALIVAAGAFAYSDSFNGPFIFDDVGAIRDNPTIRHFPAWKNLLPPYPSPVSRRPVVNLSFAVTYALSGPGVRWFHAGNVLMHLLSALLLFGIVRRTLLTSPLRERFGRAATGLAAAASLIWAVHPLLTESVTYLTQRTELLMGLFFLLTLYAVIRGASSPHPWRWQGVAIAACTLGMGAKEVMASAPILVLLYDRCFLSGSSREALRRRLALYLGLASTWAVLGALLIAYPWGGDTGAGFGLAAAGPWEYARTQPGVILQYLRLSVWPSSLCLDYSWPIASSPGRILPAAVVIAALLAATLWALRRAPALGFLGAWIFLILAPTSSFIPIPLEIAAERRMYLPLAAIVTGCVVAAWRLGDRAVRCAAESAAARKLLGSVLAAAAVVLVAGVLGRLTFERNADYRDAILIWQDTTAKEPGSFRAQFNLGASYLESGRPDEAIRCFSHAIELKRDFLYAYYNRGLAFGQINRLGEAARDFDKVIELDPKSADAYNSRAAVRMRAGQTNEALADCDKAIELKPDDIEAYVNRGSIYAAGNRYAEALADYDRAIALKPDDAEAWLNRGTACSNAGRVEEALHDLDKAIALDPDCAQAYCNRGNLRAVAHRYAEALRDYDRAIALKPDNADAWLNRGTACTNAGLVEEALRDLGEAIALRPDYAQAYLNRALAYCAAKDYPHALSDLRAAERLGARPNPDLLRAVSEAVGAANPAPSATP